MKMVGILSHMNSFGAFTITLYGMIGLLRSSLKGHDYMATNIKPKIGILEYGTGNPAAISNMLSYIGFDNDLISSPSSLLNYDILFIPGVGAFDHCMGLVEDHALRKPIIDFANSGRKLVGICVGMQMLGMKSEEGKAGGLGLLDFECVKFDFPDNVKLAIPHVGWNEITTSNDEKEERYYFTHSYHAKLKDEKMSWKKTFYGYEFTAAVRKDNIIGVQFHPEKSHRFGMDFLAEVIDC